MSIVTVIYNPASGGALEGERLKDEFTPVANGHRIRWSPTTADDPGRGQTAEAIERGSDTVVACGGDGTVRTVAEALSGTGTTLGIVPLGTGNLLAGNLGIPTGVEAIAPALSAPARSIDVGVVNGERFTVMAGVGFDALMIRDAGPATKRHLGSLAYVASAARNLGHRLFRATVDVDGTRVHDGRAAMVLIGNCGRVSGGLEVFPDAEPDDGMLDVAVLAAERGREWLTVTTNLLLGRPQPAGLVRRASGSEIAVQLGEPTPWELDGEDRPPTSRLEVGVERRALQVRCPS